MTAGHRPAGGRRFWVGCIPGCIPGFCCSRC